MHRAIQKTQLPRKFHFPQKNYRKAVTVDFRLPSSRYQTINLLLYRYTYLNLNNYDIRLGPIYRFIKKTIKSKQRFLTDRLYLENMGIWHTLYSTEGCIK